MSVLKVATNALLSSVRSQKWSAKLRLRSRRICGVRPHRTWYILPSNQFCTAVPDTENSLLMQDGLPRFRAFHASHVAPGMQKLVHDFERGIGDIEHTYKGYTASDLSWPKVSDPLERLGSPLEFGWGMVSHLNGVKNNQELREAYQQAQPSVVMVSSKLAQSETIYNAMKELLQHADSMNFDTPQHRILESAVRQAKQGGVELTGKDKETFNQIRLQLAKLSNDFSNNVLDATKAFSLDLNDEKDVEGLPASLRQLMAVSAASPGSQQVDPDQGPWKLTLDLPCFEPFMKHSRRRDLREIVYRAYVTRASSESHNNSGIIEDIRRLRREISALLGYKDFAALSLESKMAGQAENVWKLIHNLRDRSKEAAKRELSELQSFASSNGFTEDLNLWDLSFWAERQREHLFSFNDEDLRPYFPLPKVLEGLFNLTSFLFSVQIQHTADGEVEKWHDDVQFYKIFSNNGEHIASFYLDPYSRPAEKRGGAWMDQCQGRSELLGTKPVAYLVCNQTPPQKDKPSLMTFREVETLFHEFGHGLQHMLTQVPYASAAGINNVEWDAVELPSQFMENWLYDPETIGVVSSHYQTGERLPDTLFQQVLKARKYMAGSAMLRQLYFSALDLELHTSDDPWLDVMSRIADEYTVIKPLQEDRFPCSFQHIFSSGYAAGYYSYKWAEVMAADAFSAFEDVGLSNREEVAKVGTRFRDTVLGMGGGTHPRDVFREFRGRDAEVGPLLRTYGLA
ncbi:probable cytosolic oligopeptidase A isoform X2 [Strongylocentrotus purpuratus]|uniref:oligopeptidase A n=1 Tax=Strongylocentrotus purpuratus TaxID=7668 RepID=A0A7M7NS98_STRPU|nr:probable cytosolic oligopeptidase A isoform X2 [Strongylocentrotus purpuratus]